MRPLPVTGGPGSAAFLTGGSQFNQLDGLFSLWHPQKQQ
jgi:hypothetical protein